MHLELLVEERSAKAAVEKLLPKIVGETSFRVHAFEGKRDLLRKLPRRLRGYARFLPDDWRIVVLVDQDRHDCRDLKLQLEAAAFEAGLRTRRAAPDSGQFLSRIAIEELEAWFLGDSQAILRAFPRVPEGFERKAALRNPDAVAGGTWESLERLLQTAGYFPAGLPKIEVARRIAEAMDPDVNRSGSFCTFRDGLRSLLQTS